MTVLALCNECKDRIDTAMYKIRTKQSQVLNIHLEYCKKCDKYNAYGKKFSLGQEKEALQEMLNRTHRGLDEIVDYILVIPLSKS
jgi:NMD protein affecting ribosome stability and mRNA decay